MLNNWLTRTSRDPSPYKFPVTDFGELKKYDDEVATTLGSYLLQSHANPVMIEQELLLLLDDVTTLKLDVIKEYLEKQILPEKVATRHGNFGEIVAANLLIEFDGCELPIYKLRLREKRDWSIRLTDLCLVKKGGEETPSMFYGEVKTRTANQVDLNTGIEGHNSLATEEALESPEILRFVCNWLYETNMFEEAKFYSGIRLGKIICSKRFGLFIVHNTDTWDERILQRLNESEIDSRLVDFSVNVIYVSDLKELIDLAYEKCVNAAEELIYGQEPVS